MRGGEIEETVIPRNLLDVLAQHLVSMAATDEWEIDDIERLVTSAEPFSELSREQLENVLDMLDGRYPSERFASCARGWPGTGRRAACEAARAHASSRSRTLGRSPTAACTACTCPTGAGSESLTRRWCMRRAPRPDIPARGDDMADRGDHPRP